jgi:hypothetical protein
MTRRRELLVANLVALLVLLVVLLIGWWQEAAFGLAVLAILDLLVFLRERPWSPRHGGDGAENMGDFPEGEEHG